ncbi:unnamed protein product, partial [Owenia fusiformis]
IFIMAAKTKVHRLESEIEKSRSEAKWGKCIELAAQVTSKQPSLELLVKLVIGQSRLEQYLEENPPSEKNTIKARSGLRDVVAQFTQVIHANPKDASVLNEAQLLLGKAQYAMGAYNEALASFEKVNLEQIPVKSLSNSTLRIIAESYAIKGMCLEKLPATSKFKRAEKEERILRCYEKCGDIALLYLQEKEKDSTGNSLSLTPGSSWSWSSSEGKENVGSIIETAIQRSPLQYIKNGELCKGINRFRDLLRAVETRSVQGLRQTLARQLAEVLLRGVCEKTYHKPQISTPYNTLTEKDGLTLCPRTYTGDRLFSPHDENEETLLLLLIAESMATREAVLNRSPELLDQRLHTFHNTTAVYDLLTLCLVKRAQFEMLSETFERAMRFSFDEFHIWYQFALSLICAEKPTRALLVLRECSKMEPRNAVLMLQAAKLCYESLHLIDEGLEFSERVVDLGEHGLLGKGYVAVGMGQCLKASESKTRLEREELHLKALQAFQRAHSCDPQDYLALYHLALHLATLRQVSEAVKYTKMALEKKADHIHSLHLLILLLSAQKQYQESLDLMEATLAEYPDNLSLLFTRSKLEECLFGSEEALGTCLDMLKIWRNLYETSIDHDERRGTGLIEKVTADKRGLAQLQLTELRSEDSGSVRADSIAASRVEQALSDVASSMNSSHIPKQGPQHAWALQTQIWLHLGELYLNEDRVADANASVQEAATIYPLSHQVSYMRGRVHEHRSEFEDAKKCYENALSINPVHIKSQQHLGMVLHHLHKDRMAEKVLRDSVNLDPTASQSWNNLGIVLQSLGEYDKSSECLAAAVELDLTSPVIPFHVLPKLL